ncbi:hypothetical protein PMAYCL1PPCAC_09097, partial [Pristionchus mayeri]
EFITIMDIPGTIFYWLYENPMRLYVKWNGKEIDAKLPAEAIYDAAAHGNAIYFKSTGKVISARYNLGESTIILKYHKKLESQGELFVRKGLCSIMRDGKKYIYGMWEDPNRDGILVDVPDVKLKDTYLKGVNR